jgi:hypothetical protein
MEATQFKKIKFTDEKPAKSGKYITWNEVLKLDGRVELEMQTSEFDLEANKIWNTSKVVYWLKPEKATKYYFITYQATNRQGTDSIWNQVINVSPMKFIKDIETYEQKGSNTYYNFVVLNTCEISEDEFNTFGCHF